ncbi:hypothetical protein I7J22_00735 [Neisseria meningitidis]|uniref:hypothetical protein n=1 Tax=Neisseria meningitidis TaxID=487 RepID=UPI00186454CD|nr:hypothetical protein [Neisseria meningitidis]MBH2056425.1 hypothetical protein [Neisseria meningitidis]MBH2059943.1 hypothetical protein [Neisseria meningitidis]MBH2080273.1 hypothetical protein [Neisseria meningitidis]MBH2161882.1 hypothetical protein [Neisseria meningitidis]MBH2280417.1 hypothetical protein [Neisseria meningitidis]
MPSETHTFILLQTAFASDIGKTQANLQHTAQRRRLICRLKAKMINCRLPFSDGILFSNEGVRRPQP